MTSILNWTRSLENPRRLQTLCGYSVSPAIEAALFQKRSKQTTGGLAVTHLAILILPGSVDFPAQHHTFPDHVDDIHRTLRVLVFQFQAKQEARHRHSAAKHPLCFRYSS